MPFCARKIYLNTLYLGSFCMKYALVRSFLHEKCSFYEKGRFPKNVLPKTKGGRFLKNVLPKTKGGKVITNTLLLLLLLLLLLSLLPMQPCSNASQSLRNARVMLRQRYAQRYAFPALCLAGVMPSQRYAPISIFLENSYFLGK